MHNHITIYSSGIADLQRGFAVVGGEPTKVALSVNRDHLGDVLGSLNIFGPVTLVSPPTYAPQNEIAGKLELDPANALEDLAVKFVGAKVQVKRAGDTVAGTLLGLHRDQEWHHERIVSSPSLVVLMDDGLTRIALREILRLQFLDEAVNDELAKALQRQFRQLKPDSTVLELTLATEEASAQAIVQYTVPAAAWKISYRLREQESGRYEFQGFAVVDNHTDEDWNDVLISVVTGEPITFSTDLAITKLPGRDHVDLVKARALGAQEVEEAMPEPVVMGSVLSAAPPVVGAAMKKSKARGRNFTAPMADNAYSVREPRAAATVETAAIREVGDFAVFHAQTPVSIGAHRSALVPIFQVALEQSRSVLYYKASDWSSRGYRAIEFTNTTPHSLGRGVCSVFADNTFLGSCVLPATSPGGDALLVHALETGVRFQYDLAQFSSTLAGIRISDGACVLRKQATARAYYRIENLCDEQYTLVIDHTARLQGSPEIVALTKSANSESPCPIDSKLSSGVRLRVLLAPRQRLDVEVTETKVESERVMLIEDAGRGEQLRTAWLVDNIIERNGPLSDDPSLKAALEIEGRLNAKAAETAELAQRVERLSQRQDRLRKNIATGGQDEQTARWRVELGEAEQSILELEEQTLPRLRAEELAIRRELRQALLALVLEWKA